VSSSSSRQPPGTSLRERQKARTRRSIQEHALRLFLTKGYQATTVEEIASAAGVSHMTFFRYFPSKEAVVETDDYDPMLVELIRARPDGEGPLTALHRGVLQGLAAVYATDRDALLARTQLIFNTPALQARMGQNLQATERLFADVLAARLRTDVTLEIRVLAAAGLAALTTAIGVWAAGDGADDLPRLVDRAFGALDRPPGGRDVAPPG
jgi:AcrR family transcriptional regulator